jgi:hypothetical protein
MGVSNGGLVRYDTSHQTSAHPGEVLRILVSGKDSARTDVLLSQSQKRDLKASSTRTPVGVQGLCLTCLLPESHRFAEFGELTGVLIHSIPPSPNATHCQLHEARVRSNGDCL